MGERSRTEKGIMRQRWGQHPPFSTDYAHDPSRTLAAHKELEIMCRGVHILPLVERFAQRPDLHCIPGLTSALTAGTTKTTSAQRSEMDMQSVPRAPTA